MGNSRRSIAIFSLILASYACGTAEAPGVGNVADAAGDGTVDVIVTCPGGVGCACNTDVDCPSISACAGPTNAKHCAKPCDAGKCTSTDQICATGQFKHDAAGNVTGTIDICLYRWPRACQPCAQTGQCALFPDSSAICADIDGSKGGNGYFCASGCSFTADCPAGNTCKAVQAVEGQSKTACVPDSGVCGCSEASIAQKAQTSCTAPAPKGGGKCQGTRVCAAVQLGDCKCEKVIEDPGCVPTTEVCDGIDNNCNDIADDVSETTCDDANLCTDDSCGGKAGCLHAVSAKTCDDADACTTGDACGEAGCAGSAITCDDNDICTDDNCDAKTGCVFAFNSAGCSDGDTCTGSDACALGKCLGKPISCDDNNACTLDVCVIKQGCDHSFSDKTCDDSNSCTLNDFCHLGACVGDKLLCNDSFACTNDSCDMAKGCLFTPVANPACDVANLPYAIAFTCNDKAVAPWKLSGAVTGAGAGNSAWQVGVSPIALPGNATDCGLLSGGGKKLACSAGQSSVGFYAESPTFDAGKFDPQSKIYLHFESAGTWTGATAELQGRALGDAGPWLKIATVAATDGVWVEQKYDLSAWIGKAFKLRLALISADCNVSGTGWMLRNWLIWQDLCGANNGGCDLAAACTITGAGATQCKCNDGYKGDGKTCGDIDECANGTAGCSADAACTNAPGGFACACKGGFEGDGKICKDINECTNGTAGCSADADCTNAPGLFACTCKLGFSGDGKVCVDINECVNGTAGCSKDAICTNSPGAYTCKCNLGYGGDGKSCADVNECAVGNGGCSPNGICSNSIGSFACACKPGFKGDGIVCADVDECAVNMGGCNQNATCNNSIGSYSCVCKGGYKGDGLNCSDIDECAVSNGGCSVNGTCSNTIGAYTCACKGGFSGDGVTCTPVAQPTCAAWKAANPNAVSGNFAIDADGAGPLPSISAHCDMVSPGGPYTWVRINDGALASDQNAYTNKCAAYGMEVVVPRTKAHALAIQADLGIIPNLVNVFPNTPGAYGLSNWSGKCKGAKCGFWVSDSNNAECGGFEPNGDNSLAYRLYRWGEGCNWGRWNDANNTMSIVGWVVCSPNDK